LEHHSESMEAIYAHVQGLKVVIPSNPYDAKGLLLSAIRDPDTVLYLEPKKIYRSIKQDVPLGDYTVPLGKAEVKREGKDATLVSWGAMIHTALEAADALQQENISTEIIDLRSMFPMDTETIIESVKKTGRCVVLHEASRTGGLAGEIFARINENAFTYLEAPPARVTGYDIPFPLALTENYYMPNAKQVVRAVKGVVNF